MSKRFFDRRLPIFGNRAVLILCIIFFLIPFAGRGARESMSRLENNIKDWLPSDFPETKELEWFGKHFVGEKFILATWEGCTAADPRYRLMIEKLGTEFAPVAGPDGKLPPADSEDERAQRIGDEHGLFATGNYFENAGGRGEKWLLGDGKRWYFITPEGELYLWNGGADLGSFVVRSVKRLLGRYVADGELIATVGDASADEPNPYHADPRKITARLFHSIRTGPQALAELSAEGGALWPIGVDASDEDKPRIARQKAYQRLTGTLFGPAIPSGFSWKPQDFKNHLPKETLDALPPNWNERLVSFVDRLVEKDYGGDRDRLVKASAVDQTRHWDELFVKLRVDPPPRQTCMILTMSKAGERDIRNVIGRPVMGAPPGKLLVLAHESGVLPELYNAKLGLDQRVANLRMGGPPVDNAAIDEEGVITLVRLVGFSAIIGLTLSLLCFRSITVTIMVFFVGGVSAVASLAMVFWSGVIPGLSHLASVDAVLLSMPSLVYVLGLSGAVHIVNYYREAVHDQGIPGAAERALSHGWGPCTLAAFTTALGLISLFTSNLLPIKKFGFYSAVGVMLTLGLLFFYLPAALTIWPFAPKQPKNPDGTPSGLAKQIEHMWLAVGRWISGHHWLVTTGCMVVFLLVGLGLNKINTSVQLLKLFDAHAKIINDYRWLETHMGKLVPMELVVQIEPDMLRPTLAELKVLKDEDPAAFQASTVQLSALERLELTAHIQQVCEDVFGEDGQGIIGQGMSAETFMADLPKSDAFTTRGGFNAKLEERFDELPSDYVCRDQDTNDELWRISERLGALNDVDYGLFVHDQKLAVEPVLTAYRFRKKVLRELDRLAGESRGRGGRNVLLLGVKQPTTGSALATSQPASAAESVLEARAISRDIDQDNIFETTLIDTLRAARCSLAPHDPMAHPISEIPWEKVQAAADCVVLISDHPDYDIDAIRSNAKSFIDARDHIFKLGDSKTAAERGDPIRVVYTGVVPVVYKAQRTSLERLIESIALAFVMIAIVMMVLLRDWRRRPSLTNSINVPAGIVAMIPNVFPVVLVFGAMGHWNVKVDIGTMMCASVAMGVAVDDTIHYLTWFRIGLRQGLNRNQAILEAYRRVATAMTQTTLIGGLGLAVFALSTFTPTQRFGVMMVTLLAAALVGDLVLLPALLAGPLGRFFELRDAKPVPHLHLDGGGNEGTPAVADESSPASDDREQGATRHSSTARKSDSVVRSDSGHQWPRH